MGLGFLPISQNNKLRQLMTVLLRRTPTQTASRHSASLPVHKLESLGLPMTLSATSNGDFLHNVVGSNTLLRSRLFIITRLMEVVHHVLKEVDRCRYEALSLPLCVRTLVGLQNQHKANAFLSVDEHCWNDY